ncbi:unnamed protein product [Litomosoides sigmodontis]|uniref:Uncharacterized protein n=1 Tax=Litomosoides sigmodontis TaxID=42156 RepID=A0A3P6TET2_LITSI|nr:unnamed protein product [Litomosoides sigmodontis]
MQKLAVTDKYCSAMIEGSMRLLFKPGNTSFQLWDLGTDHYLHFPVDFKMKADYCAWFVDCDYWKSLDECDERKCINDSFLSTISIVSPSRWLISAEDLYYIYYRLWELSKLDDLIREQKDLQKSVMVDGVNQSVAHCYSFAKLWKQDFNDKGNVKQEKTTLSDDDDEEDGPVLNSDTEAHYECGFSSVGKPRTTASTNREVTSNQKNNRVLCRGILTTKEAYGFEVKKPSDADMAKYVKYACLSGCTSSRKDLRLSGMPKRLNDLSASAIPDYSRLQPTSFFKSDSVFSVSLLPVSEASMEIYIESIKCAWQGPKLASEVDLEKYGNYALERRSAFALQLHTEV